MISIAVSDYLGRGGTVANITYADMSVRKVQEVISVSMFYSSNTSGLAPVFANLTIVNITADSVDDVGSFECLDNSPCHGEQYDATMAERPDVHEGLSRDCAMQDTELLLFVGISLENVQATNYKKGYTCKNAFGSMADSHPEACLQASDGHTNS